MEEPTEITQEVIEKVYKRRLKKMTAEEIAEVEGLAVDTVNYISKTYLSFLKDLDMYEEHKTDIFMGLQKMIVGLMLKKADKATFRDLSTAFGILEDKLNLRQGKSTANIAVGMTIKLEDLVTRKEQLEKSLLAQGICRTEIPGAIATKLLQDKKVNVLPLETMKDPEESLIAPEGEFTQQSLF